MSLKCNPASAALGMVAAAILTATLIAADTVDQKDLPDAKQSKPAISKPAAVEENAVRQESVDASGLTRWQLRAQQKRELARDVTWLTHEPLEFLMRRGDHFDDEADRYQRHVRAR